MKPPDWLAARVTFSERATSIRCDADSLVQTISAPALRQISSAALLAATGKRDPRTRVGFGDQGEDHEERLVVRKRMTAVVHDGHVLATRIEDRAEVGTGGLHQFGHPCRRSPGGRRSERSRCWRTD